MRLLVDRGLGGVDVLGRQAIVVISPSGPETQHGFSGILDRPQHTSLEEVPALGSHQAGLDEGLGCEPFGQQVVAQHVAAARRISHPELHRGILGESAPGDEISGYLTFLRRHLGLEELRGCLVGGQDLHA